VNRAMYHFARATQRNAEGTCQQASWSDGRCGSGVGTAGQPSAGQASCVQLKGSALNDLPESVPTVDVQNASAFSTVHRLLIETDVSSYWAVHPRKRTSNAAVLEVNRV
jgi:hypothetical protein